MGEEYVLSEIGARFNQVTGGSPETDVNKRVFAITGGEMNLLDLFRRVFGFRGVPYGITQKPYKQSTADIDPNAIEIYSEKATFDFAQKMGSPIFQPLRFEDAKLAPFQLPNEPLVTLNNTKRLVETPSAGGTQDVIEHISLNFYTIKIQGFIVNMETDDYPDEEVRKLRAYYELPRSFKVFNPLLSYFDINLFACKTFSLPAVEGHQAIQGYEITGRSDKPYQLVKKIVPVT